MLELECNHYDGALFSAFTPCDYYNHVGLLIIDLKKLYDMEYNQNGSYIKNRLLDWNNCL
jgi:hypothetical protein